MSVSRVGDQDLVAVIVEFAELALDCQDMKRFAATDALVVLVGPGQAGDAPMFPILMDHLRVDRRGPGRPRTRPDRVRGDKAYSSRAIRQDLRDRDIVAVIPEPADQQGHRKRRGSKGGRPVSYDVEDYKGRNVVERGFNEDKQWRGIATRYDKLALTYRGGAVLRAITLWLKRLGDTP